MIKNLFNRSSLSGGKDLRPALIVHGDAQAEALALVLNRLPDLTATHDVLYCDSREVAPVEKSVLARCAYSLEQDGTEPIYRSGLMRGCKRLSFPALRFKLLWPLATANPYNDSDKGAFPWGDGFIIACLRAGVSAQEIMQYYEAPAWSSTWPKLDSLFSEESARLSSMDAKCDVKIGSFVLKNFRKDRLFWSIDAPTNRLLSELAYRALHAAFGPRPEFAREAIQTATASIGVKDVLGAFAMPVHPLVASHFGLEWFDAEERYAVFGQRMSFTEYYSAMIDFIAPQVDAKQCNAQETVARQV